MENKTEFFAFISTGDLSAMYTLWTGRHGNGHSSYNYIRNLAAKGNEAEAERKALEYCEALSTRLGVEVKFHGFDEEAMNKRRGKLSVKQTQWLEQIERGVFPFGKNVGKSIEDAEDSYILYFADKHSSDDVITAALGTACLGVAIERDLINKRDQKRMEIREENLKSEHIGEIGQRIKIEGEIVVSYHKESTDYSNGYTITKIKQGNDLITYFGKLLGNKGDKIRLSARIKDLNVWEDIKSTVITYPTKIEIFHV